LLLDDLEVHLEAGDVGWCSQGHQQAWVNFARQSLFSCCRIAFS